VVADELQVERRDRLAQLRRGPKTAMTASPMNFSTVPPCRSSTLRTASK
jgi:hypothetical protein